MRNRFLLATVVAFALSWSFSAAAKDKGFYLGGSVGSASISVDDLDFDESDVAWKVFGGYQLIGLLAFEGSYVDFGSPSAGDLKVNTTALDLFGVVGLPVGPVRLFGKLGAVYWDADIKGGEDDDSTDLAAGLGLEFELASFGIRGEVEYFDALDDVYMLSVGATYTF